MEKISKEFKEKVDKRISSMGMKKSHLAKQMNLDPVRYSQTMSGKRNITAEEMNILKTQLGI